MSALRETLQGALVMAPMTKGSNLPYRRLCQQFGARVTMSEMAVARRLRQKRRGEFALIRKAAEERFFGVKLAGNNPDEMRGPRSSRNPAAPISSTSISAAPSTTSPARDSARRSRASPVASAASSTR